MRGNLIFYAKLCTIDGERRHGGSAVRLFDGETRKGRPFEPKTEAGENMKKELLKQYAQLVAGVGINVQKGQTVVVRCPVDCADFGRALCAACFELGAKDVVMEWRDDVCSREHWLHADDSVFDAMYPWDIERNVQLGREGAGFISVSASDPENLRGVSTDRLRRWEAATGRDQKEFHRTMMANGFPWCVVSVPVLNWAKKVFPNDADDAAMEKLWDAIFSAIRVTEGGDAVEAWRAHCAYLEEMAGRLNALQLRQVRYKNALGTDVVVGLPDEHVWMAGADTAKSGVRFVANMPTEEIFSAPKRDAVDGVLAASKPLALNGNVIEGIRLTLEHGRIVGIHADTNEEVLRQAIETDEGAHYLGEIALVPVDSPIAQSGLLFYNTLFDENAACHFAFGQAYPACVPGGDDLPEEELVRRGINVVSTMHVDFMVGTEDLSIIGTTKDGREVTVFENGRFAL